MSLNSIEIKEDWSQKLIWRAQQIMQTMKAEWKVTILSREATANIDRQLEEALQLIKEDFRGKERQSRREIIKRESTSTEI